jgi:hypothetical protein
MSAQSDNQLDENSGPNNTPGSNDSGSSNLHDSPPASNSDHDKRDFISTCIIQAVYILWLAPILTLLIFNFRAHIVGASAWCPRNDCHAGIFNFDISMPIENLRRFDKQDHNLLGALQVVAKIIDIWFTLIVAALVTRLTFLLAKKKKGLTIGLLARPFNFADLRGTFESLLWTSDAEQDLPGTWKATNSILGRLWKAKKSIPGFPGSLWKVTKSILACLWKATKSIFPKSKTATCHGKGT